MEGEEISNSWLPYSQASAAYATRINLFTEGEHWWGGRRMVSLKCFFYKWIARN
jgi:hypothetical protein